MMRKLNETHIAGSAFDRDAEQDSLLRRDVVGIGYQFDFFLALFQEQVTQLRVAGFLDDRLDSLQQGEFFAGRTLSCFVLFLHCKTVFIG
jgi:hypothetical protein